MTDEVVIVLVLSGWLALCSVVNVARNLARARAMRARAREEFDQAIGYKPSPAVVPRLTEREREQQAFERWCAAERVRTERARLRAQYPTVDDRLRRAWDTSLPEPPPPAPPPKPREPTIEEQAAAEVNAIATAVPPIVIHPEPSPLPPPDQDLFPKERRW